MKFSELSVGDQFKYNGKLYTKTEPKKVSCCKTLNSVDLSNNKPIMIKPTHEVEKVESAN
jgi:hypothetical protein